jgi:hypothetical protein
MDATNNYKRVLSVKWSFVVNVDKELIVVYPSFIAIVVKTN